MVYNLDIIIKRNVTRLFWSYCQTLGMLGEVQACCVYDETNHFLVFYIHFCPNTTIEENESLSIYNKHFSHPIVNHPISPLIVLKSFYLQCNKVSRQMVAF